MENNNWLNYIANICQIIEFQMNITQLSNDDLMKHLLKQDNILDVQTNEYLKKIVEQNEQILKLLKGGKNEN